MDDLCQLDGSASLFILLDLSVTFDTIEHGILQDFLIRMELEKGTVLQSFPEVSFQNVGWETLA